MMLMTMLRDDRIFEARTGLRSAASTGVARKAFFSFIMLLLLAVSSCKARFSRQRIFAITGDIEQSPLSEHVGIEEAAYNAKVDVYWNGPRNLDVQRQIDLISSAVRARSYGVAINPASIFADNTAVRDALKARIPVVILLDPVRIAPAPHLYFVLEDTRSSAALVTQRLKHLFGDAGEVAILGLNPLYPGSVDRFQDLEAELQRDCPGIRVNDSVVEPFGYGYLEIGAERILREHPQIEAIVALNVRSGMAAVAAIRNLHYAKKVRVIVFDQSVELFVLLRKGAVDSIVAQDMRGIGSKAVSDIVADRNGQRAPQTAYLEPMLVTRDNIDEEKVQQFLLMNWQHP
jgi:ribose transport system substrate-binding protein